MVTPISKHDDVDDDDDEYIMNNFIHALEKLHLLSPTYFVQEAMSATPNT